MVKLICYLIFAEVFTVVESDGEVGSQGLGLQSTGTHGLCSINTLSTGPGLLMFGLCFLTLLTECVGVKRLGMGPVFKDPSTDVLEFLVVIVFIEGILLQRCVFVLDGAFVTIHRYLSNYIYLTIYCRSSITQASLHFANQKGEVVLYTFIDALPKPI
jgi:hypothetical protein